MENKKILRVKDVVKITGFSHTWIYKLIKQGDFPKKHKIGKRAVGFCASEVDRWVSERLGDGDHGAK